MAKKIMICQSMNGISEHDILCRRKDAIDTVRGMGFRYVDTYFRFDSTALNYLAVGIQIMDSVDYVAFMPGWEESYNRTSI